MGLSAYPLYQLWETGGPIFYTTNADEASHLSYWYANYVVEESGRLRVSSRLVRWLHSIGVSGGYINFYLDIFASLAIILCFVRIYRAVGCSEQQSRLAALLTFLTPLFFTCFNPILAALNELRLTSDIVTWFSMPHNSEVLYLRSPEPQLSWAILAIAMSLTLRPWMRAVLGILISPLLYPFVKLPALFVSLAYLASLRVGYSLGILVSFVVMGIATRVFVHGYAAPSIMQFFIFSRLPVFSCTGLLAGLILLSIHRRIPIQLFRLSGLLVASIWVAVNVQLVSGWLVTPVNYEQYWGVFVLGVLTALGITFSGTKPLLWLGVAMGAFGLHIAMLFCHNAAVLAGFRNRQEILQALPNQASRIACDDVYLATYLDLAFPMQAPTALSWTRTLHASNNDNYVEYLCVKHALQSLPPSGLSQFKEIFSRLEYGYSTKGSDLNVTMGRQRIVKFPLPSIDVGASCPNLDLITNMNPRKLESEGTLHS